MKIVLTGGGTGGHFYPLIAVAEEIRNIAKEQGIEAPELYFFSVDRYDEKLLAQYNITFKEIPGGKIRRYFSLRNISDLFVTFKGFCIALWNIFSLYPDAIFSKGGYPSVPNVLAAAILGVPIIVHDSDSKPGLANSIGAKFAKLIAISYPDAAKYFNQKKVAWTGNPLRKEIMEPVKEGSFEEFGLEQGVPVILVLGGSQGAQKINDALLDSLPQLVANYQIIHQTGPKNFESVKNQSIVTLEKSAHPSRYKPYPYLSEEMMRKAVGATDLVISRAGSTIFEIAVWNLPSIIIPIPERISHDQRTNAYSYARSGACSVIEEANMRPEIISAEVNRIMNHPEIREKMIQGAKTFARKDAARIIAQRLIDIGLSHKR